MQEEDAKKAAKENAKENKRKAKNGEDAKEVPMRRPAAAKPPKAPKEKAVQEASGKKAEKKAKVPKEPMPKPRGKKRKAETEVTENEEVPPTDPKTAQKDAEKEKRRVRANAAWEVLQKAKIPGLQLPNQLNGRISFTCRDPNGQGSSVGVILASESFYISKARPAAEWPTTCTHLKVGYMLGLHVWWQCQPLRPMFFDP